VGLANCNPADRADHRMRKQSTGVRSWWVAAIYRSTPIPPTVPPPRQKRPVSRSSTDSPQLWSQSCWA